MPYLKVDNAKGRFWGGYFGSLIEVKLIVDLIKEGASSKLDKNQGSASLPPLN